jgi:maltose alpha-D-glucosyltransferase/alpha-amylase
MHPLSKIGLEVLYGRLNPPQKTTFPLLLGVDTDFIRNSNIIHLSHSGEDYLPPESSKKQTYPLWLEDAIFYQLYPQSFYDSNADGIGDLPGILQKLDYLQSLSVTALWINPCFDSPFQDAGYDVRDYYQVAPRYGTNEDMHALFAEARRRGMHILLDLVPGHTSIDHPWFKASSQPKPNAYSDWYIWTGSAWEWDVPGFRAVSGLADRDASYLTNFFYFQPALNYGFAAPDPSKPWQQSVDAPGPRQVRAEMRNVMRFWLEMGASGFRVDMAHSLVKNDPDFREMKPLWREIRGWLDRDFPEAVLVSEWSNPTVSIDAGFHMDFLLPFGTPGWGALFRKPYTPGSAHDPYGFSFFDRSGHGNIHEFLDNYLQHYTPTRGHGLIAFPTGNHDINPRLSIGRNADDLKLIYLMLLGMPGVPFIYYGDEIGMRTVQGLASKEGAYDRTGIRTPMQWDSTAGAGFSTVHPNQFYLPLDPDPARPNVASQDPHPESLLNHVRRLAALRRQHRALHASADFQPLYAEPGRCPFVFMRTSGTERIIVAVNPSAQPVDVVLEGLYFPTGTASTLYGTVDALSRLDIKWHMRLPPIAGGMYQINE